MCIAIAQLLMISSVSVMDRGKTKDMIIVYLLKQTSTHDSVKLH